MQCDCVWNFYSFLCFRRDVIFEALSSLHATYHKHLEIQIDSSPPYRDNKHRDMFLFCSILYNHLVSRSLSIKLWVKQIWTLTGSILHTAQTRRPAQSRCKFSVVHQMKFNDKFVVVVQQTAVSDNKFTSPTMIGILSSWFLYK